MALGDDSSGPVRYWVGPPPPAALTWITRLLELATFLLVVVWIVYYLGGVGLHPTQVHLPSWRSSRRGRALPASPFRSPARLPACTWRSRLCLPALSPHS